MNKFFSILFSFFLISISAESKVIIQKKTYHSGKKIFEGVMAYDGQSKRRKPGVVVFHNWMGVTDETISKITELAKLGYTVFAADIYGKGIRPKSEKEASELSAIYKNDRALLRERANLALIELVKSKFVDDKKIMAVGYCFGGMAALELGRDNANLLGIVTFHGALSNPNPDSANNIKGQVANFHGALDPFVTESEVKAYKKEMDDAKIPYQFTIYSGAVHSFTEKGAGSDITKGAAYNELADHRSWEGMKEFLEEVSK